MLYRYGPQSFDSRCQDTAGLLCSFLNKFPGVKPAFPEGSEAFKEKLHESALISLFKLATFRDHALQGGATSMLQFILSALPFDDPSVEVRKFHRLIVFMACQQDKRLLKDDQSIVANVVSILKTMYDEVDKESLASASSSPDAADTVKFWDDQIVDEETWAVIQHLLSGG